MNTPKAITRGGVRKYACGREVNPGEECTHVTRKGAVRCTRGVLPGEAHTETVGDIWRDRHGTRYRVTSVGPTTVRALDGSGDVLQVSPVDNRWTRTVQGWG